VGQGEEEGEEEEARLSLLPRLLLLLVVEPLLPLVVIVAPVILGVNSDEEGWMLMSGGQTSTGESACLPACCCALDASCCPPDSGWVKSQGLRPQRNQPYHGIINLAAPGTHLQRLAYGGCECVAFGHSRSHRAEKEFAASGQLCISSNLRRDGTCSGG